MNEMYVKRFKPSKKYGVVCRNFDTKINTLMDGIYKSKSLWCTDIPI